MHSGYVSTVDKCKITGINCYVIGTGVLENYSPDNEIFNGYGNWTIYHTNRKLSDPNAARRLINTGFLSIDLFGLPLRLPEGYTDQGTIIQFYGNIGIEDAHNCHGYTFNNNEHAIIGYFNKQDKKWHNDQSPSSAEQSIAVEIILRENGYQQVQATGPDASKMHFQGQYDVGNF